MFFRLLAATAALLLVSCGSGRLPLPDIAAYRIEIQQGNFVSQEMVAQLKPGMSKDQVRFVMGTPLITDSFHSDRWDYVFRRQRTNSRELEQRNLTVFFEDGKLKHIEGDVVSAAAADEGGVKASAVAAPSRAAAQSGTEAPKPATGQASPGEAKPQEKSWWERLKDKLSR